MKKKLYIIVLMLLSVLTIFGQGDNFSLFLNKQLYVYNRILSSEKIYLQTDKTFYKPGEKIWFKAFLLNACDNRPSNKSDVMHIELRDARGNTVQKQTLNAIMGTNGSAFSLTQDAPGGLYKLIAYTSWMKNFGEENYFTKEITVQKVITPRLLLTIDFEKRAYGANDDVVVLLKVTDLNNSRTEGGTVITTVRLAGKEYQSLTNTTQSGETSIRFRLPADLNTADGIVQIVVSDRGTEESITRSIPIVLNKIALHFYPEGGDLIEGVHNKVAFEALNEFGKGADISGVIRDESGTFVCDFNSFHLGMGAFEFTPLEGKKYFANINIPQGNETPIPLPIPKKEGFALHLQSSNDKEMVWVVQATNKADNALLTAHTQGKIYFEKKISLKKGSNIIRVDTKVFPIGIAVFTLFANNRESAERLVYLNTAKRLNISIEPNKSVYTPAEKVVLTIKTTDADRKPVSANIGLAVVDEQLLTMADDKQDNLLSSILFSSELKGKIQEPPFYFNKAEAKAEAAIDYLLLTHGWRRFSWDDVLNSSAFVPKYVAENMRDLYGFVLDKNGNPTQAEVFMFESEGKRRIGKLLTTVEGQFVFHNIDPTGSIFLATKRPNQVYAVYGTPAFAEKQITETTDTETSFIETKKEQEIANTETSEIAENKNFTELQILPETGNGTLNEVVVVGNVENTDKRMFTGASSIVLAEKSVESSLQGRAAGVEVTNVSGTFGSTPKLRVRGASSVYGSSGPLFVVDGVVINDIDISSDLLSSDNAITLLSSAIAGLNEDDIESAQILQDGSATAIYGARAMAGVIVITTKKGSSAFRSSDFRKFRKNNSNYGGMIVNPRQYYETTEYDQSVENSELQNSTVYWNANIITDESGTASVSFNNNKQSSTFRLTAEGLSATTGLIGSDTTRIVTRKAFSLDAKSPLFAGVGDVVKIPVLLRNTTENNLTGNIKIRLSNNLKILDDSAVSNINQYLDIPANASKTVYLPITGLSLGECDFTIIANAGIYSDTIKRALTVRSIDFPRQYSFSDNAMKSADSFLFDGYITGTVEAEAVCYIQTMDQLMDGVESIFREPSGCFEQVSSSTFPNIFALQLLRAGGYENEKIQQKALQYLEAGYKKLAAYEVKNTGGFEWYGGSPAHEVLSAYGLVEFYEMSKVYEKIDWKMVNRTLNFILDRKNGKGGFKQNNGRYGFSGAPYNVNNAYIVFALTETKNDSKIKKEYDAALNEALLSNDMYRMALMANASFNINDMDAYNNLIEYFLTFSANNALSDMKVEASIVRSGGDANKREATAFWLLALLKNRKPNMTGVDKCIEFINKGRRRGSFGNTQTTSICLQALSKYAILIKKEIDGSFCFSINDDVTCTDIKESIAKNNHKVQISFADKLKKGNNTIQMQFVNATNPFPYSVNISWRSLLPETSKWCPLKLTTNIAKNTLKVNQTVRLSVTLENKEKTGKPMSIAIIGIPGGLSLQAWQLKELQEQEIFDFYEIINDNLVIYYRELEPHAKKEINLDLKAEIPGEYTGIASSAYLYYSNEHKYWIKGISVKIEE